MRLSDFQFNFVVDQVSFATSRIDNRCHNILFDPAGDYLHVVATDGIQMAICTIRAEGEKLTVPIETAEFLKNHIRWYGERAIEFYVRNDFSVYVRTTMLDLEYPNHAHVFPKWETVLVASRFDEADTYIVKLQTILRSIEHTQEHVKLPFTESLFNRYLLSTAFKRWKKKNYRHSTVKLAYSPTEVPAVRFQIKEEIALVGEVEWTYVLAPIIPS
jgi:DNA polymerase III sliding clamp (beta) subunit (PCNA family)